MRSDLIFGALAHVTNRYTLCKPNTRLQDTTNEVLVRFHHESPAASSAVTPEATQLQQRRAA
jgi:hypothetical protein